MSIQHGSLQKKLMGGLCLFIAGIVCNGLAQAATERIPLPSQSEWINAKKTTKLSTGITMKYVEAGDPSGTPAIFLHGWTDSSRSFSVMLEDLMTLRPDLRVLALDMRGHGASSMPAGESCASNPATCFRTADFAADVLSFMDNLRLTQAYIVGHSLGTMVAQELAFTHPDRILRMALLGTGVSTVNNPALEGALKEPVGRWLNAVTGKQGYSASAYLKTPRDADSDAVNWIDHNWEMTPVSDPSLAHLVAPEAADMKLGTWTGVPEFVLTIENTEKLKSLSVSTLVLWGTQDVVFTDADEVALRRALDQSRALCHQHYFFKTYGKEPLPSSGLQTNDIGHTLHWEAPKGVAADLAAYLRPGGEPTRDLYYADQKDLIHALTARDQATILTGPTALTCTY
jgi:non-heme chloroperoxidase